MAETVLLAYALYLAYLLIGWTVLRWMLRYTVVSLRRELALNGVGDSPGDGFFRLLISLAYLFVLHTWPLSVHRKLTTGRVIGKDMREKK